MAALTLFHTAEVHVETFDRLAPKADLTHVVRPDWLERAQGDIDSDLRQEITQAIAAVPGASLCTCTTIGELAETAGATRIDWPMMQIAARIGGPVLMAYCLDSTLAPSSALLRRAFQETGQPAEVHPLDLTTAWPLFQAGDTAGFAAAITAAIMAELKTRPEISAVVLAQASMAAAGAPLRSQLDIPVLTSPEIALQALLPSKHKQTEPKGA